MNKLILKITLPKMIKPPSLPTLVIVNQKEQRESEAAESSLEEDCQLTLGMSHHPNSPGKQTQIPWLSFISF